MASTKQPTVEDASTPKGTHASTARRRAERQLLVDSAPKPTKCDLCANSFDPNSTRRAARGRLSDGTTLASLVASCAEIALIEDALCDPSLTWLCVACVSGPKPGGVPARSLMDLLDGYAVRPTKLADLKRRVAQERGECESVATTLSQMVKEGRMQRVGHGMYVTTKPPKRTKPGAFSGLK